MTKVDGQGSGDVPRMRVSVYAQMQRFLAAMHMRRFLWFWLEEWVWGIARPIPGFVGVFVRYPALRLLCKRVEGFPVFATGVRISHAYGIRMGHNLRVNTGCFIDGSGDLTFGSNVLVGPNSVVMSSSHRFDDPTLPIVLQGVELKATTVGDDVWIGANVTVAAGVTLATGTVVAAGAVVTADTEPYSIVGGIPARKLRERPRLEESAGD